jgi:rhodanese-related sulfurtransferase
VKFSASLPPPWQHKILRPAKSSVRERAKRRGAAEPRPGLDNFTEVPAETNQSTQVPAENKDSSPLTIHARDCQFRPGHEPDRKPFMERSFTSTLLNLTRRNLLITGSAFAAGLAVVGPAQGFTLDEVEKDVSVDYPSVEHVLPKSVPMAQSGSDGVLLLDVREEDEFAVSHLPGAIRVDPGMNPDDFMARFGGMAAGKQVVFYCSVGVRSSQLAERVGSQLSAAGAKGVANLSGGIFRWHNKQRRLVSRQGPTDLVHPYNRKWGALVTRQPQISYTPVPGK